TVSLAERAEDAGLTQGARFPMMKKQSQTHHGGTGTRRKPNNFYGSPWLRGELVFMRIAYLECFSGISGDMFLGALADAGVPPRLLEDTVAALGIGARLEISHVMRSGISATKVNVWIDGKKDLPREEHARE